MPGNNKRFLRFRDYIIRLDAVRIIRFVPDDNELILWFGEGSEETARVVWHGVTRADFERIAATLTRHGERVKPSRTHEV
jgi:hypothetical protein